MDANGAGVTAQLADRVAAIEAGLAQLARRIEEQYRARLLDHDRDLEDHANCIEALDVRLRELAQDLDRYRAALSAAQRGD